ncbi:ABC transporter ATP-binding protein [Clostridium chauvoei]|uniref:ABC transporter ATP-binding protein n=3 Tax=Clostridium chauvoei TaxID=46867 RepID=A0ABD4RJ01_9CLOT|nr:ABC transporter ATP-binding protein [Clostridium chauvoei]ATD54157.1 ABC transporter [Clostridium chauvoei]ATD58163.1 ABC transporter [Clostridium chauvoei]MBX7281354.1 ABC transporter ATP-binding protein [Clostridium chauvoei]MBX7283836.1 ABC transporter ATP-binding protein [Clostridium chauvoei]MBX7288870.1 ABC transporter ATP-binding protein [Clostridium chauvoei]
MTNILEIKNLSKNYTDFSLKNLNLNVPTGCITGFIGENGAGKSTTIKLILDIIHRDNGEIKILGTDNKSLSNNLKEEIGVVLDESCFPENLNLTDIDKIMKRTYKSWDKDVFEKYSSKFSLPKNKSIKDYSKGMKMKLSIAVALSHNPKLLILDEATSGLDPIVRDEILDVFLDFIQDENHSIFISSHIISDLEKICDYIAFIHKGQLIFNESKDELLDKYGLLKCSTKEFDSINKDFVIGYRKNTFGIEALVVKNKVPKGFIIDNPSIEDIMLYHVKETVK